ncbi:ATP-dependent RNA helicase HrpA [Desulfobacterales bacterium HSG16]|nr:ATP-dependent RNA helicase HrpA [Desulfobacterales bacterium HSG16]
MIMNTEKKNVKQKIDIRQIQSLLSRTMGSERFIFNKEIRRLRSDLAKARRSKINKDKTDDSSLNRRFSGIKKRISDSMRKRQKRIDKIPEIRLNTDLPIVDRKDDIIDAIVKNQVVIISGETGSGKTTQIPKLCLIAGRGIDGKIGCTQPRRIAASSVARRIAEELGEELGKSVGYKIRFQDNTHEDAYIKIMTDGILLAETQRDTFLNEYDTIIVDEAHERSLNIDFVLGILKNLLKKRKNLKLLITSATIDTEKFSKAFDNAPVIEVSGRMYPVESRYMQADEEDTTHVEMAAKAVRMLMDEAPYGGDILTFMPTEQDIRETCDLIESGLTSRHRKRNISIMPLFARLSAAEQTRVFAKTHGRKIIVATNVAETSITIPGIKYVVDTGLARISRYLPRSKTTALPVIPVSRSSADQRMGRCGRVENGICVRLFSEDDYNSRPLFTPPEILRSNLAEVILRMISLKLGDVKQFPFIDKPADKSIRDGFNLLEELGAIKYKPASEEGISPKPILTEKGILMAKIPLDPRLSCMLIEAKDLNCIDEMTVIASALSIQDPRERPVEKEVLADQAHALLKDRDSDFITLLNIWKKIREVRGNEKGFGPVRRFCKKNFISFRRIREWQDIHRQIRLILKEHGFTDLKDKDKNRPALSNDKASGKTGLKKNKQIKNKQRKMKPGQNESDKEKRFDPLYIAIHKSILSGFLSNIAKKKEKNIFQAARDRQVMIFPGSGLFNKAGIWVVASEMVETSRLFARIVANIDVTWLEPVAKDRCRYLYTEPHYERKRGEVVAKEQVSLYGLVIVPGRTVSYGPKDPQHAREIFITNALVEADTRIPFGFMKHNRKLIDGIRDMEDKIRKRDVLISEQDMFDFYDKRIPDIYDVASLKQFLKRKGGDNFLKMNPDELTRYSPQQDELAQFPDKINISGLDLSCQYRFDPKKTDDGVTVKITSDHAGAISKNATEWLVPGLLKEKITLLIKGLPKQYRKRLVPVSGTVDIIIDQMDLSEKENTSLANALGKFIYKRFGVDIPAKAWPEDDLPDHLKMRFSITGPDGKELYSGRDRHILAQSFRVKKDPDAIKQARKKWDKTNITTWDFGNLPETMDIRDIGDDGSVIDKNSVQKKKGPSLIVFPGLEYDKSIINRRLFSNRDEALASHKAGVMALFRLVLSKDLKFLKKTTVLPKSMEIQANYFGGIRQVEQRICEVIIFDLFSRNIRKQEEFFEYAREASSKIVQQGKKKTDNVIKVLKVYHESRSLIYDLETRAAGKSILSGFYAQLRDFLLRLVPQNFITLYDTNRMPDLERYIRAISIRAQRGPLNLAKDLTRARKVKIQSDRLDQLLSTLSSRTSDEKREAVENYFWMIEELKVSLFAQELKTPVRVSEKRLDKMFGEISRMI